MSDRRVASRVPVEMMMNQYVHERLHRVVTLNVSETGLYVNRLVSPLRRPSRIVGLEFELPGTGELVWARGLVCHDAIDGYFHGEGIRFAGMAKFHERLVRDYVREKRQRRLAAMLDRIRATRPRTPTSICH